MLVLRHKCLALLLYLFADLVYVAAQVRQSARQLLLNLVF